ncbi:fimbrial protein [Pseudomonas sp. Q1-7]|uniref:fimbrial protein n=1 Tax=Pseudomonas sp. Q1-7 TaxID=3020843 RepID=UPI002300DF18|nr:fimbrial protein [Pseudomonas sp. Q1-7]
MKSTDDRSAKTRIRFPTKPVSLGTAFVLTMFASVYTYAACNPSGALTGGGTTDGKNYYYATINGFSPPPFSPGDTPIGGVIYEATGTIAFQNAKKLPPETSCSWFTSTYVSGIGVPDANNVYPTGIAGVGMRIIDSDSKTPWPYKASSSWLSTSWKPDYKPTIQLVRTGEITAHGTLSGAFGRYTANTASGDLLVEYRFASPVSVLPSVPTCEVGTTKIDVPMGRVVSSTTFSGVGSTSPTQQFEIALRCSGGDPQTASRAFVTLTDAASPGNTSNRLSLSGDSTAKGIAIQILKDSTVLSYGPDSSAAGNTNQWSAGTINQGQAGFRIPLEARYVQTEPEITAGSANASATFTMSYQ